MTRKEIQCIPCSGRTKRKTMSGKEQVKLLIESLELRLKQVKENKKGFNRGILIYTPCPLCRAMGLQSITDRDNAKICEKCVADISGVCSKYTEHVISEKRTKLLQWLRYQIRKWKTIYSQIGPLRKKLEQWKMDE